MLAIAINNSKIDRRTINEENKVHGGSIEKIRQRRSRPFAVLTKCQYAPSQTGYGHAGRTLLNSAWRLQCQSFSPKCGC